MDITRYIGLFLLKNKFCYIHGLGNLTLIKRPATLEGDNIKGPEYVVQLTPTGSIDDNLANFIAVNEQISIAKASNALRDFSVQARADLSEGKEVIIPSLGRFVQSENQIYFVTDPDLQYAPPAVPTVKFARKTEEPEDKKLGSLPKNEDISRAKSANRTQTFIWILIFAVIGVGIVFGVRFLSEQSAVQQSPVATPVTPAPAAPEPEPYYPVDNLDSNGNPEEYAVGQADVMVTENDGDVLINQGPNIQYEVVINSYEDFEKAEKRERRLTSYGNHVKLKTKDSSNFYIVVPMNTPAADTTRVIDSLRRLFNPQGTVFIYK